MRWRQLSQQGPCPEARSSHALVMVNNKAYVFGGENKPRTPIDSAIHCYDLAKESWMPLSVSGTPPCPRLACAAAAVASTIYIFGGRTGVDMGEGALGDLFSFDTETNIWAAMESEGEAPPARSFHAMAAGPGSLYLFGGCGAAGAGRLADLWRFDTRARRWQQLPQSPHIKGRGGACLVATADSLFVMAGFSGGEMSDLHRFDLASNAWECPVCCAPDITHGSLPARSVFGAAAHACASCDGAGDILVFGGEVDPSAAGHEGAGKFSSDTFILSPARLAEGWQRASPAGAAPSPRGWFAAAPTPTGMLMHGGNSPANQRLGDMYLLEVH